MVPFADLLAALDRIPDPRRRQGRRYPLAHLLLFSVLAVLAGATSYRGILVFIAVHRERLNAVFGAALRRAPAVNTLRALFLALDPAELEAAFRRHAGGLSGGVPAGGPRVIALDGKTLKRSFDHLNDRGRRPGAQRVRQRGGAHPGPSGDRRRRRDRGGPGADRGPRRAWRPVHRRCPARPEKTFASAANTGAALLVRVKANQPSLHDALVSLCAEQDPFDRHATVDRGRHGRQEHRRVEVFAVAGRLPPEWREVVACAARITRLSWCKDTRTGLWRPRREVAYYVSQVALTAEAFGRAVRAHWLTGVGIVHGSARLAIHGRLPPRKGSRRVRRSGLGCRHPSGLDGHRPPAPMSSADRLPVMNAGCSARGKRRVPPIPVRPFTPSSTVAPAARGSLSGEARPARACASGGRASPNPVHVPPRLTPSPRGRSRRG